MTTLWFVVHFFFSNFSSCNHVSDVTPVLFLFPPKRIATYQSYHFFFKVEDDENFEFDYEDEEGEEPDVDLENKYYNAKGKKMQKTHSFRFSSLLSILL